MKPSKFTVITIIYCGVILWFSHPTHIQQSTKDTRVNKHFDGPEMFIKLQHDIRTPVDATAPAYTPGYKWIELQKAKEAALRFYRSKARTQSNGVIEWTERGPVNVPGRTRGLVVDPDDSNKNTWYAGSVGGGVWKTTNAGQKWAPITPDLSNLATTVLEMAPSNHNVMYIGTGEGFGNTDAISGSGMFKTTDRGATWTYLPNTSDFTSINRMIIDPTNENIVVVASNYGIYKTTDGGDSWEQNYDLTDNGIEDLKATPGNFAVQYATDYGVRVLKSTDGGKTWNPSWNIPITLNNLGRIEIAIAPSKPNRIYASCENGSNPKILMSDDAGVTWSVVRTQLNGKDLDFLNDQGWYDNSIACDPFNENRIYHGGVDLYYTVLTGGSTNSILNATTTFISEIYTEM